MRIFLTTSLIIFLSTLHAVAASGDTKAPQQIVWPFDGLMGSFDRQAAQRGLQIYREVCASCHSLERVAFRNLAQLGFSEAEIKAIAKSYSIVDGPNDDGEMFERPGIPADFFPHPFINEKAARAANNGAYPVDLSLIVKARPDGANYTYSLLKGYDDPPEGVEVGEGMYYNPYFSAGQLSMPPPLVDEQVEYMDDTKATLDQMSRDVVVFLQWAAEPDLEKRKKLGLKVMLFLIGFTILFFIAYKRVWKRLK